MNKKYVTSIALSKRLKGAGWPQVAEFWWIEYKTGEYDLYDGRSAPYPWSGGRFVAPLASELLEALPHYIGGHALNGFPLGQLQVTRADDGDYVVDFELEADPMFCNKNLCDALAEMWIYLKEQLLIA